MIENAFVQYLVLPWLQAFALASAPILATVLGGYIVAQMKKRNLDTAWFEAISRAGGEAYLALVKSGQPINRENLTAASVAGAVYMLERAMPLIMAKGGRTPEELAQIAGAELGKLLAADPTIGPVVAAVPDKVRLVDVP